MEEKKIKLGTFFGENIFLITKLDLYSEKEWVKKWESYINDIGKNAVEKYKTDELFKNRPMEIASDVIYEK